MERILGSDLIRHIDKPVMVRGWMNSFRPLGKLNFLILRDRTGFIQIVIENREDAKKVAHLQPGSILRIKGKAVRTTQAGLGVEIVEPSIEIETPILTPPLVEYYKPEIASELEFILDHRSIALRNRKIQAVFKIQAELTHAYRVYMHDHVGAVEYFSPNVIGASSEGGAEFFNVDYFGYTATLAQSSQLYKQIMVGVYERVYSLAPFFRAEPSHTPRHISEGKQLEFEMGFFSHWHEILDVQEGVIKAILQHLQKHCFKELEILETQLARAPEKTPIPRVTFEKAQEIYFKRTGIDERKEPDLSPAAEKELCKYAFEEHGTDLIFITDWKMEKRPFYAFQNADNPALTNTFDLLCAGLEITSGGQRRDTYEDMVEGIKMKGMDPANFEDYLCIFKYGMPPHGGFGMGLERLTMTLLHLKNIREASLFPSDTKRIAGNRIKAKIVFGGENMRNEIIRKLREQELPFEHFIHEETATSQTAATIRNTPLEEGVKSLIVRGKSSKKNYQFNLPANCKLDMKAVMEIVGEKCDLENPEVIKERYGLMIGGVPPFGNLLNLDNYFDEKIFKAHKIVFSCGLRTESIQMLSKDLMKVADPKLSHFSKTE
ncbi:MAG TPA: aspartate--tRNA(Asn) ligase [Rhabdochlamydiaceae bacterium]|nr:aspartate--tRNA(Asn) ligase [Rhabdochlamydiaceae bacterium]